MIFRRLLGVAGLLAVMSCAGWLVMSWSNLLGWPSNRDLVVIAVSPDTTLYFAGGQVQSLSGSYLWSNPHTGQWHVYYGIPLAFLVVLAALPAGQLLRPRREVPRGTP